MNKSTLFLLLFTGWYAGIDAQVARPVTISGQVKTDRDSVKLVIWFARDPLVGFGNEESQRILAPVSADGRFSFTTPAISQPARLSILDGKTGNQLFSQEQQIIAPGDQIELTGSIHDQGEPYYFKARFSGKGATKYECIQALKAVDLRILDTNRDLKNTIRLYDSLLNRKQIIINSFKKKLAKKEYHLIKVDMIGELKGHALNNICGYRFGSIHTPRPDSTVLAQKKKTFDELIGHFNSSDDEDTTVAYSMTYRKYLYQKAKAEQVFENNGKPVQLIHLFKRMGSRHKGIIRDKLLATMLLDQTENYYFFGGIDPDEQLQCLQQASTVIRSGTIKEQLQQSLKGQVKGAQAFNFTLPLDSSETKKISLSDLKGKVVLLDLWSYQCTGCVQFTNTFHKKIYPFFQDNPQFVVVSVMLGESNKVAYMRRLRREGNVIYTFPEYVNLFGGQGISSARDMEAYYKIEAFPTIMLIDKQGKIYSSTLPIIYGDPRNKELTNNMQKLTELIKKALAEPEDPKTIL